MNLIITKLEQEIQQPRNEFVFLGTTNWMRALAIKCNQNTHEKISEFYKDITQNQNLKIENLKEIFSSLQMSLHYLESLDSIPVEHSQALSRLSIVAWYYGIYYSSKSMIAATTEIISRTHDQNAYQWFKLNSKKLIHPPFDYCLSTLVKTEREKEIEHLKNNRSHSNKIPKTIEDADGWCVAYLKGTAEFLEKKEKIKIKKMSDYKKLGVQDFKATKARELRDSVLKNKGCAFLDEAYRYRLKPNYKDAQFLIYTSNMTNQHRQLIVDLRSVLESFIMMSFIYCSKRLGNEFFQIFKNELSKTNLARCQVLVDSWLQK